MQVKEIHLSYKRPDEYHLYPIGDIHGGTKHCAEKMLARKIKQIQEDKLALWLDMGDSCEFITPHDPRWDSGGVSNWLHDDNIATDQVNWYCDMMSPIKDKCIGKLEGNHEVSIRLHNHDNVQRNICEKLGITDLGYSCFIKFVFERGKNEERRYIGFFTHGAGGAITAGAKLIRLQRLMDNFEADIIASGHIHDIISYTKPYLILNNANEIKQRVKVGAMTGCWFKTYTQDVPASYGERKNFPPVAIGCPRFVIIPDKNILKVEG